jgi:hypothetical protein
MSSKLNLPLSPLRFAAIALSLAAAAALPAYAQQEQPAATQPGLSQTAVQNLQLFSSSSASDSGTGVQDDAVVNERANLGDGHHFGPNAAADPQYGGGYGGPPRRRPYGRPTYKDRWTNSDGSSKFAFEAGVGPSIPAGSTGHYQKTGVDVSVGAGRNFNRVLGVLLQYDYAHMGVANSILDDFSNAAQTQVNGATHLWSLTLNPVITFSNSHSHYGSYLVFGGGFYRKMTVFSLQGSDEFGDEFSEGCGRNCHVSNNAGGLNGGLGFFYKISTDSNAKIFAEARYTWVDNQPSSTSSSTTFPPTNYRTGYFPVALGVRF